MAAIFHLLGHLAPNNPCFDPNLNNFAQNGRYFPFTWPFVLQMILVLIQTWTVLLKMAAIFLLLGHLATNDPCLLLVPVQTWSALLKMASISFEWLIWLSIAQNGCQFMITWPLVAQNGFKSTYTQPFGSTCYLFQSRPDKLCSKWLPFKILLQSHLVPNTS